MPIQNGELLKYALIGCERQKEEIDGKIAALRAQLGDADKPKRGRPSRESSSPNQPENERRTMSPAARKRIAAAQRKRWAAFRKTREA